MTFAFEHVTEKENRRENEDSNTAVNNSIQTLDKLAVTSETNGRTSPNNEKLYERRIEATAGS